jgi:hypothetical protein
MYSRRKDQGITGLKTSVFFHFRNVKLGCFTADHLISFLNKFNQQVDVKIKVPPRSRKFTREVSAMHL